MARNWESLGITWSTEQVTKGDATFDGAQIPQINVAVFVPAHENGDDIIQAAINSSNSVRVGSQAVNRRVLVGMPRDTKRWSTDVLESLREEVYKSAILGIKAAPTVTVIKTVKVYSLPGGGTYEGSDEVEYQQLWAAAAHDAGMDATKALEMAAMMKL